MKFDVTISRKQVKHFIVDAKHRREAIDMALNMANDTDWTKENKVYKAEDSNILPHITRKHRIKIGETIYDCNLGRFGVVLNIIWSEQNELSYEIVGDNEEKWIVKDANAYQIVPNRHFYGHLICYEHNDEIEYPYYCPYYDENMYEFETRKRK